MKIEFIKDFATRKKGYIGELDGMLATTLINKGVAKKYVKKARKKNEPNK